MKKIERPDWASLNKSYHYSDGINGTIVTPENQLNEWFDQCIQPLNKMLSEGLIMYASGIDAPKECIWSTSKESEDTLKALLINIQPITKETAENVLGELVMAIEADCMWEANKKNLLERAKAVLGEDE